SFVRECSYLRLPKDLRLFPAGIAILRCQQMGRDSGRVALEPDPYRSGIVHPQHRLLQEVILVERPERLDPHVALLACIARVEQHEAEAGLRHDLTVRLAELPLPGEQREPVGEAGRGRGVEELLEFRDAHLRKAGALAAEEELGANERVPAKAPPGIRLRE